MILEKIKQQYNQLSLRDRRSLKIGVIIILFVLTYGFVVSPLLENYGAIKYKTKSLEGKLSFLKESDNESFSAKEKGILKTVPNVEVPLRETQQKQIFRDSLFEQLRSSGVKITSNLAYSGKAKKNGHRKYVLLKCAFSCNYQQFLKLLGEINSNPHLLSIEELKVSCDEKKRNQLTVIMGVSTLVK